MRPCKFAFRQALHGSVLNAVARSAQSNRPDIHYLSPTPLIRPMAVSELYVQALPWAEIALTGNTIKSSSGDHGVMAIFMHLYDLEAAVQLIGNIRFIKNHRGYIGGIQLDNPFNEKHPTRARLQITSLPDVSDIFTVSLMTEMRNGKRESEHVGMPLPVLMQFRDVLETAGDIMRASTGQR